MLVQDHMTRHVITVSADSSAEVALGLLRENEIRQLPVVSGKRILGIVTQRDLLRVEDATRIADVMTREPVTIGPGASFDEAARLLRQHKFNALPVVQDGELVGVVTTADVLEVFVTLSGVTEPSYRIILKAPATARAKAKVRGVIEAQRGEVLWLHRGSGAQRERLHVRLKARSIEDITLALEGAGFEVATVVAGPAGKS